jgi:large subunit ribosomal protein L23
MEATEIIIAPVLTEKTNWLKEGETRKYVFRVSQKANKYQIMKAVKALFSVNPTSCSIMNVDGKVKANTAVSKESYRRGHGKTSSWKKAIVTLKKGEQIAIFEGA